MQGILSVVLLGLVAVSAFPNDPILKNPDGIPVLADKWMNNAGTFEARYDPDRQNVFHLFTRDNPTVSQPLLLGSTALLGLTNYNPQRKTVVLLHGWFGSVTSDFNSVLVPAFLSAEDVNVIVVDWSAGASTYNYFTAVANTVSSGNNVASFIAWLNSVTGVTLNMYHIVGHSLGGHQAGIAGRHLGGQIGYITALDPAFPGWVFSDEKFKSTDGVYTEVIHTNAGLLGYIAPLGDVDFYPNGGINMPGCRSQECDHERSFFYFGESLTSGGFTGRRCASYITAMAGNCLLWGNLEMGGLMAKTGSSGIFHLKTNAAPPFSRG